MTQPPPSNKTVGRVSGHASFLHRGSSLRERVVMSLADAAAAFFGLILAIGGRPLREVLVRGLGAITARVVPDKSRIARINLDLVFGDSLSDAEKRRIVRGHFDHFARGALDFMYGRLYWPRRRLQRAITPEARQRMAELTAGGRGSAVVSCHLGNPELLLRLLTEVGYDGYALYKGFKSPWFDRYVARKRLAAGAGLIEIPGSRHRSENGKRVPVKNEGEGLRAEMERIWADGSGIGFIADQYSRKGTPLTFLGVPNTRSQVGAWRYVVDNRIPFLLHVAVYRPDGDLTWHCSEVFEIEDQGSPEATLDHYLQAANDWFEGMIRRYPDQYFWGHRRFNRKHYEERKTENGKRKT